MIASLGALLAGLYFVSKKTPIDSKKLEHLENSNVTLQYEIKALHERLGGFETVLGSKEQELATIKEQATILKDQLDQEIERNRTILSSKKSSEIRTGLITESLSPFLMEGVSTRRMRFLGSPIDYVSFEEEEVVFIEVKSGNSHLSHNQKRIKRLIQNKKVRWMEFRIRGKNEDKKVKAKNNGN